MNENILASAEDVDAPHESVPVSEVKHPVAGAERGDSSAAEAEPSAPISAEAAALEPIAGAAEAEPSAPISAEAAPLEPIAGAAEAEPSAPSEPIAEDSVPKPRASGSRGPRIFSSPAALQSISPPGGHIRLNGILV